MNNLQYIPLFDSSTGECLQDKFDMSDSPFSLKRNYSVLKILSLIWSLKAFFVTKSIFCLNIFSR